MPELPEVEAARVLMDKMCVGRRVDNMRIVIEDEIIFNMPKDEICPHFKQLEGMTCISTGRYGKHLWLSFSAETSKTKHLLMHFGMTGFVQVEGISRSFYRSAPEKPGDPVVWPPRFTRFVLEFDSDCQLAFGDSRRLGRVSLLNSDQELNIAQSGLGMDPILNMKQRWSDFESIIQKRRVPIKSLLLDQSFTAGVGNWMADDILLMAKIHPESIAADLDSQQQRDLFEAVINLSKMACELRTKDKEYPQEWLFHVRWDRKPSKTLSGVMVKSIQVGGRTTVYCPSVQKQIIIPGPGRPVLDGKSRHSVSRQSTRRRGQKVDGKEH